DLHLGELLQAELDADGEEQEHDADLRGGVDHGGVVHQPERVRTDHHARDEEADERDEAEPGATGGGAPGGEKKRDRIAEEGMRHARAALIPRETTRHKPGVSETTCPMTAGGLGFCRWPGGSRADRRGTSSPLDGPSRGERYGGGHRRRAS